MLEEHEAECAELLEQLRPLISRQAHFYLASRGPSATLASMLNTVLDAPPAVQEEADATWTDMFRENPTWGLSDRQLCEFVRQESDELNFFCLGTPWRI